MKRVRTARTSAEADVEAVIRRLRIRFRRNVKRLPGRPDFLLVDFDLALFVDGCFWHGCPRCFKGTQANREWWAEKILENRRRDRRNDAALRRLGFRTLRIWEHDSANRVEKRLRTATFGQGI